MGWGVDGGGQFHTPGVLPPDQRKTDSHWVKRKVVLREGLNMAKRIKHPVSPGIKTRSSTPFRITSTVKSLNCASEFYRTGQEISTFYGTRWLIVFFTVQLHPFHIPTSCFSNTR